MRQVLWRTLKTVVRHVMVDATILTGEILLELVEHAF